MLDELHVRNFALIDAAHLDIEKGFTVLSGETGAGKSILIGSLVFLLGGKVSVDQIRAGCHEADVTGSFRSSSKEAAAWLEEHGIQTDDGEILLRRVLKDSGKSSSWINGTPVTKADLAAFASYLVDLHGQHEQQSLVKVAEHRRYLDLYAGIVDEVSAFSVLYRNLVDKRQELEAFSSNEYERQTKIDMLSFAVGEIDEARLKDGEDEELEAEENRLSSFEKLYSDIETVKSLFDGGDGDGSSGISSLLRKLNSTVSHAASYDGQLSALSNRIQTAFYELDDIEGEFERYSSSLVFDPARLQEVQDRQDLIYKLKKKYVGAQASVKDVLDYAENARNELEKLSNMTADKSALESEIAQLEKEVYLAAKKISGKRKVAAEQMSKAVEEVLFKLGMKGARFCVSMNVKDGNDVVQKCGPYGMDDIEFLIAANAGNPLMPLGRVASGGELSRVMLALKTILSDADTTETLVFDEVDTGIGGEVAVAVGEHLKLLSAKKQVLCITHLASIAVYADNQIKIQKGASGTGTSTSVFRIDGDNRIKEIARMLSGDSDSQESLEHAAAMLHKFGGM